MRTALYLSTFLAGIAAASMALAAEGVTAMSPKGGTPDVVRAKARPLPISKHGGSGIAKAATRLPALGPSGVVAGSVGNGRMTPVYEPAPQPPRQAGTGGRSSQQYGTGNHPFTTSRANGQSFKVTDAYPWRATGKLFFTIAGDSYVCSASLIKKGVVLTAAHCVIDYGSGSGGVFSGITFKPAYSNGTSSYGSWTAQKVYVRSPYVNGTDNCAAGAEGIVCENDVALIVVKTQSGAYPGTSTGWYGYGYGGYSYVGGLVQITQLGYPVALDDGGLMERTDSYGYVDADSVNNTVIGSRQTGGSSGGPWLVNFGIRPSQTAGYDEGAYGSASTPNIAVGVTSWGYTGPDGMLVKQQGASPFLSTNIQSLVNSACTAYPAACAN